MVNFRSQSVDGFGERADIALERDRQQGQFPVELDESIYKARQYNTSSNARPISQIVKEMIEGEVCQKLMLKSQITWDCESLADAVTDACIYLGLGDEDFSPYLNDLGDEVEITL